MIRYYDATDLRNLDPHEAAKIVDQQFYDAFGLRNGRLIASPQAYNHLIDHPALMAVAAQSRPIDWFGRAQGCLVHSLHFTNSKPVSWSLRNHQPHVDFWERPSSRVSRTVNELGGAMADLLFDTEWIAIFDRLFTTDSGRNDFIDPLRVALARWASHPRAIEIQTEVRWRPDPQRIADSMKATLHGIFPLLKITVVLRNKLEHDRFMLTERHAIEVSAGFGAANFGTCSFGVEARDMYVKLQNLRARNWSFAQNRREHPQRICAIAS